MEKLIAELQRLYFLRDQHGFSRKSDQGSQPAYSFEGLVSPAMVANSLPGGAGLALDLVGPDGLLRAMVVSFRNAGLWEQVAGFYQALQDDLDLPAPALAVAGQSGYQLWFSLLEPVPVAQARRFLAGMCARYLADIPAADLEFCPDIDRPDVDGPALMALAPAFQQPSGKWSAFIDPSLGGMFIDGPWLEMAPNMDKQADILAGFDGIQAGDFRRVLDLLEATAGTDGDSCSGPAEESTAPDTATSRQASTLNVGSHFSDPQSFLLAVMNDSSASPRQRIRAAKALLPYFSRIVPE